MISALLDHDSVGENKRVRSSFKVGRSVLLLAMPLSSSGSDSAGFRNALSSRRSTKNRPSSAYSSRQNRFASLAGRQ